MEEMAKVISDLGPEGIQAFYVWFALDTIEVFLVFGGIFWGIRTVWKYMKENDKL